MFNLETLVRPNIRLLKPYSSARDEFKGEANVFLDANENSLGSPLVKWYNRYPDPLQLKVKEKVSFIKKIPVDQIFLGNGSDEAIDLLFRCFCEPGIDLRYVSGFSKYQ
jgi:histidinol-phosphate aminotransferase